MVNVTGHHWNRASKEGAREVVRPARAVREWEVELRHYVGFRSLRLVRRATEFD